MGRTHCCQRGFLRQETEAKARLLQVYRGQVPRNKAAEEPTAPSQCRHFGFLQFLLVGKLQSLPVSKGPGTNQQWPALPEVLPSP